MSQAFDPVTEHHIEPEVLFVCVHNGVRSRMAASLVRDEIDARAHNDLLA
jgi:hypothetical protein